jgi:K+-transporting ATPase KdpF subunit
MACAGCSLDSCNDRILRGVDRLRTFLRAREVRSNFMDAQSLIMLIVSALTTVYLFYALLRPEKF